MGVCYLYVYFRVTFCPVAILFARAGPSIAIDSHALGADLLVRLLEAVDKGQRHLVDIGALVGQVLAPLATKGRGRAHT